VQGVGSEAVRLEAEPAYTVRVYLEQGYLAQKNPPPPQEYRRALDIVLL